MALRKILQARYDTEGYYVKRKGGVRPITCLAYSMQREMEEEGDFVSIMDSF